MFGKAISPAGSSSDKNPGVQRLWSEGKDPAVWFQGIYTGFESTG